MILPSVNFGALEPVTTQLVPKQASDRVFNFKFSLHSYSLPWRAFGSLV